MVRWPGKIPAGELRTGIVSHLAWLPTLLAAAGEPEIKQKLKAGHQVGSKTFKIYLDGYNHLDYWMGNTDKSPRVEFFYCSDDGNLLTGVDRHSYKIHINWIYTLLQQILWWIWLKTRPFNTLTLPSGKVFSCPGPWAMEPLALTDAIEILMHDYPITKQPREYITIGLDSLWQAIADNSVSRVYLGVHWQFDGITTRNAANTTDEFGIPGSPSESGKTGGVWLGAKIANEVALKLGV